MKTILLLITIFILVNTAKGNDCMKAFDKVFDQAVANIDKTLADLGKAHADLDQALADKANKARADLDKVRMAGKKDRALADKEKQALADMNKVEDIKRKADVNIAEVRADINKTRANINKAWRD